MGTGEENLQRLLRGLAPALGDGEFVFASLAGAQYGDHSDLRPVAMCSEGEGLTLVIPRERADQYEIPYDSVFRRITLTVHSSLDAVGLTAVFSRQLTDHGISANVVAGYYHDHIFVQAERALDALAAIKALAEATDDT